MIFVYSENHMKLICAVGILMCVCDVKAGDTATAVSDCGVYHFRILEFLDDPTRVGVSYSLS
jgi:hypothetical protein